MDTARTALQSAAKALAQKPGSSGFSELASRLGLSRQAVYKWLETGVPAERCLQVEGITGVSRHVLRPDVYGAPPQVAA